MTNSTIRLLALAAAALCIASLLIAYFYMERYLLLEPCPLCILDRLAVGVMALGFAVVAVSKQRLPAWAGWWLTNTALTAGLIFAGRHIWLQNRPLAADGGCLSDHAAAQGLIQLIEQGFDAKADCGAIVWEFAGFTIPEQVLILFIVLLLLQLALLLQLRKVTA